MEIEEAPLLPPPYGGEQYAVLGTFRRYGLRTVPRKWRYANE